MQRHSHLRLYLAHSRPVCVARDRESWPSEVMLLRCLQASSSFEDEWAALSGHKLRTGFRLGTRPRKTGRRAAGWGLRIMEKP